MASPNDISIRFGKEFQQQVMEKDGQRMCDTHINYKSREKPKVHDFLIPRAAKFTIPTKFRLDPEYQKSFIWPKNKLFVFNKTFFRFQTSVGIQAR